MNKLFFYLLPIYCFSQVGVNNAFDSRNIYSYYFEGTEKNNKNKNEFSIKGEPYSTPLIDGYRYNSYLDVIVNSDDKIIETSKIKLGDFTFLKKKFFIRWKKKSVTGYLIDMGFNKFLRIQKNIREDYNPRNTKIIIPKYEEKISYFELIDNKIIQVKKNKNSKSYFFFQLGYINSNIKNYLNETLKNRNSIYYGLGHSIKLKNSFEFKTFVFFSKNGGFNRYNENNNTGKKIILYNTLGLELLIQKQFDNFRLFTGVRSNYAIKREERKASRRKYGIRIQDQYTYLKNDLKSFIPFSIPAGISFRIKEDLYFEIKYAYGISKINKKYIQDQKMSLNTFQSGFSLDF